MKKDPAEEYEKAREKITDAAAMGNNAGMQAFAILQLADAIRLQGAPLVLKPADDFDPAKLAGAWPAGKIDPRTT